MANDESRWSTWMRNGRLATIAWLIVLGLDTGLRIAKVDATSIDQLLTAITGVWIGNLTVAQQHKKEKRESKEVDPE